jgi:DNA polymerase III subunit epsilon
MTRWILFGEGGLSAEEASIESTRFVVIDTELTSLHERTNRLLSVGAIGMVGSKILLGEQFYRVVNPGVLVPAEGVVIHRLRPEDVERGHDLASTIAELGSFIENAVLVGHFGKIDRTVLRKEFTSCGVPFKNQMICTARVQRWIVRRQPFKEDQFRQLEVTDLESLTKVYKLDFHEAHHALDDAFVTARLWQQQMHLLSELGVKTLGKLLRFAKVKAPHRVTRVAHLLVNGSSHSR